MMLLYARRLLQRQALRLSLTIIAVALCAVMMQFLLATYRGVADGSVDYVRANECDLWVVQRNSTNMLRGTSFLTAERGDSIARRAHVRSASPVLLLLPNIRTAAGQATIFLAGYDPSQSVGGPPEIVEGRTISSDSDIVLDKAFARKLGISIGDVVTINDSALTVTGISTGTNAFVIQYGFVTLERARRVAGIPNLVSMYLITVDSGADVSDVKHDIESSVAGVAVFDHDRFLANNLNEMESGFLPLLYAIAGIGLVVMTVVLSLLLSITILERRRDFAIMKTLGAPSGYLPASIALQSAMTALLGLTVAAIVYPALIALIETVSPAINTTTTVSQVALVAGACTLVSQVSALLAMRRLRTIYAMEVFR
ncbi:MAG: ABC transporter permease [bacterium]|nr:ABC transporter permease [Candidatus Kapabacteria bacterium]